MYCQLAHFRRPLTFVAISLIAVAYCHCAVEWAAELRHLGIGSHGVVQQPSPADPAPGCDNESGCICRGATLAHPVGDLPAVDDLRWQLAYLTAFTPDALVSAGARVERQLDAQTPPARVSGRQLRALYASLLI
jgi:hypothetical protein